jgi:hypothetical protein
MQAGEAEARQSIALPAGIPEFLPRLRESYFSIA